MNIDERGLNIRLRSFQSSCVVETGLSGLHKVTATVLPTHVPKLGPQRMKSRDYNNFSKEKFRSQINFF